MSALQILKNTLRDIILKNGLEALIKCKKDIFPDIHFLITIFCTLSVSTANYQKEDFQT